MPAICWATLRLLGAGMPSRNSLFGTVADAVDSVRPAGTGMICVHTTGLVGFFISIYMSVCIAVGKVTARLMLPTMSGGKRLKRNCTLLACKWRRHDSVNVCALLILCDILCLGCSPWRGISLSECFISGDRP